MDDKIPWPFPGRVGRVFWCLVHGWCSFLWLSLDAGGPLPTLSWYRARCRERPPGWAGPSVLCSHTPPPLLASLSSAPVQGSNIKFPLCFWHLRIFFSVVWLWGYFSFIVSLFVCFFELGHMILKFTHFIFVFGVERGIFPCQLLLSYWPKLYVILYMGFCRCLRSLHMPVLSMSTLVAVYAMTQIYYDSLSHFPNVEHLDNFQFSTNIK